MALNIKLALALSLVMTSGAVIAAENDVSYDNNPVFDQWFGGSASSNVVLAESSDIGGADIGADSSVDAVGSGYVEVETNTGPVSGDSSGIPILSAVGGMNPRGGRAPATIKYGEISVTPSVGIRLGYSDNVTNASSNKINSSIIGLTPQVVASVDRGSHKYSLTYLGDLIFVPDSTIDNRSTHNIGIAGDHVFTTRNRLNWEMSYINGAEARGISDSSRLAGGNADPDEFRTYDARGLYRYGATGAKGNIELKSAYIDKEYLNNRGITFTRDFTSFNYGVEFLYRIAPKTQIVLDMNRTNIDYKSSLSTQDSVETKYLLGARWNALAKTQGYFKIGRGSKDYDTPGLRTASTTVYESGITWSPRTYSVFNLSLARNYVDGSSASTPAGLSKVTGARWDHKWKSYFRTAATANYATVDYDTTGRTDKTKTYALSALYDAKRWLGFGLDYSHINRDSNEANYSYKTNLIFLSTFISL